MEYNFNNINTNVNHINDILYIDTYNNITIKSVYKFFNNSCNFVISDLIKHLYLLSIAYCLSLIAKYRLERYRYTGNLSIYATTVSY